MGIDIRVTDIGEYITQNSCAIKFKLRADKTSTEANFPYYHLVRSPINPILVEAGRSAEEKVSDILKNKYNIEFLGCTSKSRGVEYTDWDSFIDYLENARESKDVFMREVEICSDEGAFTLHGQMDFVILRWISGNPVIRILECKSSRKDKTYHRIQLASYVLMIKQKFAEGVVIGGVKRDVVIECAVVRVEGHAGVQDPFEVPSLNLENEMLDLRELVDINGPLYAAYISDYSHIDYHLGSKCSMCTHSAICAAENIRKRKIELLGLSISENRALKQSDIHTLDDIMSMPLEKSEELRMCPAFKSSISRLKLDAETKMAGLLDGYGYPVQAYNNGEISTLPDHVQGESRLICIYLDVEWDPVEDRLLGVAAHITDSEKYIYFEKGKNASPDLMECDQSRNNISRMNAKEVSVIMESAWTDSSDKNDLKERELLENFFLSISNILSDIGNGTERALHFYVWSESDMRHFIDGCKRAGGDVLGNLVELLGCRAECTHNLEQVIYSSIYNEIKRKISIGKISQSLASVTSLGWFGWYFHWNRHVGNEIINFRRSFRQDIFDLIAKLDEKDGKLYSSDNGKYYEVRIMADSLISLPYWHMMWDPESVWKISDSRAYTAMTEYRNAGKSDYINGFMKAKCQALRWLDERLMPKETQSGKRQPTFIISKPPINLNELTCLKEEFKSRYSIKQACLDFLKLDHSMKESEWLSNNARPTFSRVMDGSCIPLKNISFSQNNNKIIMHAQLDLKTYGIDNEKFFEVCEFEESSFVRIIPYSGSTDSVDYSLRKGVTAIINKIDFIVGDLEALIFPGRSSNYIMSSRTSDFDDCNLGIVVSSISDFTNEKVSKRIASSSSPVFEWFNPLSPKVPPKLPILADDKLRYDHILYESSNGKLNTCQRTACIEGLECRVQLLFGPPGTGKTNTMAYATLLRLMKSGEHSIFLISANTHTAINELISRINTIIDKFVKTSNMHNEYFSKPAFVRLSDTPGEGTIDPRNIAAAKDFIASGRTVFCGTVGQIIKLSDAMVDEGFLVDSLIIDEASMMIFPHFLSLASTLDINGDIMLAGDILQLSPITSYDWNNEQREQIEILKPYQSAYAAIRGLCPQSGDSLNYVANQSPLTVTYRMNEECTDLISEIYDAEGINLISASTSKCYKSAINSFSDLWDGTGVYLIVHDEHESKKYNPYEVSIIQDILRYKDEKEDAAVITPHRAQKSALKRSLGDVIPIDTVERFQGGQCSTIIVSGTQSDATEISGNAEFILDLNRTNVIFSRAKNRLIVVCSKNLLNSVPSEAEEYENSILWKKLRSFCSTTVFKCEYKGHCVEVRIPPLV